MNTHTLRHCIMTLFFFFVAAVVAHADAMRASPPEDADPAVYFTLQHRAQAEELYKSWRQEHAGEEHMLIRYGLRADRSEQFVEIVAEASGLPPSDPVEFVLISEMSGHDYEALAISHALPSDIHAAMEFIGMKPGTPFNPQALRFLPKGERVFITFHWTDEDGLAHSYHAEELVMNARTGTHLEKNGFVFVGSQWLDEDDNRVYAADMYGPQAIVSLYNEPTTVFDVPRAVSQGEVYGFLAPYPERQAPFGQFLRIRFTPEYTDGRQRIADVTLAIRPGTDEAPVFLTLTDTRGEALHDGHALHQIVSALSRISEQGQTPYLTLDLHDDAPVNEIRDLLRLLQSFQKEQTLHIEPPQTGDLFYRAFVPPDIHRDRAQRPTQALELRMERENDAFTARVVEIEDIRARREDPFEPEITEYDVATPSALAETLAEIDHRLPVLLVFVPSDTPYGAMMEWVRPVMDTHHMIHVFLE